MAREESLQSTEITARSYGDFKYVSQLLPQLFSFVLLI